MLLLTLVQWLMPFVTFVGVILGIIAAIVDLNERWQRHCRLKEQAKGHIPANHPLPSPSQPVASTIQQQESHPTAELNGEAHPGYEMGYQAIKGSEHPLQQEQQGR